MKAKFLIPILRQVFMVAFVFACGTTFAQQNIFDAIRPGFELSEFIARSQFVYDFNLADDAFINALKNQHIDLQPVNPAAGEAPLPEGATKIRFTTADNEIWFQVINSSDGNYLFQQWREQMKATEFKTDMRNGDGTSVYLVVQTPNNSALGALIFTGRNTISLGINLPFPIPDLPGKLDSAKINYIIKKFQLLQTMLASLAKAYVKESEFFFYASGNEALTREQRLYGLIQFWTEVKYNFAFFDHVPALNWDLTLVEYLPLIEKDQTDAEYYRTLEKMCALLKRRPHKYLSTAFSVF